MSREHAHNGIDYIEIPAPDVAAAKAFYAAAFGWTFEDYGPDYQSFHDGRMAGGLTSEGKVVSGGPLIVMYVDDVDAAMETIKAAGGTESVPKFAFPGGVRAHFKDPNGNELAVWSEE